MASVTRLHGTNFGLQPYTIRKKRFYPFLQPCLKLKKVNKFFLHNVCKFSKISFTPSIIS